MSNPYDRMMESLLSSRLGAQESREQRLAKKAEEKRRWMDPNYEVFDPDLYDVTDADTLRHRRTGEEIRVTMDGGESIDSFETNPDIYADNPQRFRYHQQAYARLYGRDPDDVSVEDLVDFGLVQKRRLQQNLESLRGVGLQRTGKGTYNRTLAKFEDSSAFEQARGTDGNASYFAPSNAGRRLRDRATGDYQALDQPRDASIARRLVGDQAVNFVTGAGRAANSLVQAAVNILPGETPEGLNDFFEKNRTRLDKMKEALNSDEQLFRERMDQKEAGLNEELYSLRKDQYRQRGLSEQQANIAAGYDEFQNRIGYLIDNPGRVLDATVESLPYMIGVGVVGRIASNAAIKKFGEQALKNYRKAGLSNAKSAELAKKATDTWINSKVGQAALAKTSERVGVTTVGLTEGLTNAADTYSAVAGMTEEQAQQSVKYQELRKKGLSHGAAIRKLANDIFFRTLFSTAGLAAVASKYTGAAGFEANLFRRGAAKIAGREAGETAARGATEGARGSALRRGAAATGRAAGRYTAFAGAPGLREAAEESIQSGGGEFLSQLAQFDAGLVDQVGPGIGAATGEGALVGFASGAGAQTLVGGAKKGIEKIADLNLQSSGLEQFKDTVRGKVVSATQVNTEQTNVDTGAAPANAEEVVKETAEKSKEGYDAEKALEERMVSLFEKVDQGGVSLQDLKALEQDVEKVGEGNLSENQTTFFNQVKQAVLTAVNDEAARIVKEGKDPADLTPTERAMMIEAFDRDLDAVKDIDPNSVFGKVRNHIKNAAESTEKAVAGSGELLGLAQESQKGLSARVQTEKLEDVVTGDPRDPRLGLKAYRRVLLQAIADNDADAFNNYARKFRYFLNSQAKKVNTLFDLINKEGVQDGDKLKGFYYKRGNTERFYNRLRGEQQEMNNVAQELREAWSQWTGQPVQDDGQVTEVRGEVAEPASAETEAARTEAGEQQQPAPKKGENKKKATEASQKVKEQRERRRKLSQFKVTPAKSLAKRDTEVLKVRLKNLSKAIENYKDKDGTFPDYVGPLLKERDNIRKELNKRANEASAERKKTAAEKKKAAPKKSTKSSTKKSTEQRPAKKESALDKEISYEYVEGQFTSTVREAIKRYEYLRKNMRSIAEEGASDLALAEAELNALTTALFDAGVAFDEELNIIADPSTSYTQEELDRAFGRSSTVGTGAPQTVDFKELAIQPDGKDALNWIRLNSKNEAYRGLAKRLLQVLGKQKLKVANAKSAEAFRALTNGTDPSVFAAYNRDTKTIVLQQSKLDSDLLEEGFLHEAIHAILNEWLDKNPKHELAQDITRIRAEILSHLQEEYGEQLNDPTSFESHIYKVLTTGDREEVITWGLTDPRFQELLKGIKADDRTLWDAFVEWMSKVLGVNHSILSDLIDTTNQIFLALSTAETEVVEQAEAQPQRSSETEVEGDKLTKLKARLAELTEQRDLPFSEQRKVAEKAGFGSTEYQLWRTMSAAEVDNLKTEIRRLEQEAKYEGQPIEGGIDNLEEALDLADAIYNSSEDSSASWNPFAQVKGLADKDRVDKFRKWLKQPSTADEDTLVNAATEAIKALGLPTTLKKGLQVRNKNQQSLLTSIPNLHEILADPKASQALYKKLGLSETEAAAMDAFSNFRKEFADALQFALAPLPEESWAGEWLRDNPSYIFTDGNERIDPNMVTMMAYEAMTWLSSSGVSTIYNDATAIRNILGMDSDARVDDKLQNIFSGAGTLRRNVANELGNGIWNLLNVSVRNDPEHDAMLKERIVTSLGYITTQALLNTGRAQPIVFDAKRYAELTNNSLENVGPELVNFMRITPRRDDEVSNLWTHLDSNIDLRESWKDGRTAFTKLLGDSFSNREPLLEKPGPKNIRRRALRSLTKLSDKMWNAISSQNARAWQVNKPLVDLVQRFGTLEEYAEYAHKVNFDVDGVHKVHENAVDGRNRAYVAMLENLIDWSDRVGDGHFYFTHQMIKTGRVIMTQNMLNPQNNKVHRFLLSQVEWTETVPTEINPNLSNRKQKKQQQLLDNFKLAAAMGFGIKVDKQRFSRSMNQLEALAQTDTFRAIMEIMKEDSNEELTQEQKETLGNFLKATEGSHTLAALKAWADYEVALETGSEFTTNLPMETDGITNGFAAGLLQTPPTDPKAWEGYLNMLQATGVMVRDYNNGAVNAPEWSEDPKHLDNYQTAAQLFHRAMGAMLHEGGGWMRADITQARKQGRAALWRAVFRNRVMDNAYDIHNVGFGPTGEDFGQDQSFGRDLTKNPLMIVSYLASPNTVARNFVGKTVDNFYEQLAGLNNTTLSDSDKIDQAIILMNNAVRVANVAIRAEREADLAIGDDYGYQEIELYTKQDMRDIYNNNDFENVTDMIRTITMEKRTEEYFRKAMDIAYGEAIKDALNTMIGSVRETRNTFVQALTLMNAIYAVNMQRLIQEEEAAGRKVGPDRIQELKLRLHKEGLVPSIATPISESQKKDKNGNVYEDFSENLELTKDDVTVKEGEKIKIRYKKGGNIVGLHHTADGEMVVVADRRGADGSVTGQIMIRIPTADVGVAGMVAAIHMMDGTNNAALWGEYPALNLHDATAHKLSQSDTITYRGNEVYYNQHRDYDIGQELYKSLRRMTEMLNAADGRLNRLQQDEASTLFMDILAKHFQIDNETYEAYQDRPLDYVREVFFPKFVRTVTENTEQRRVLFEGDLIERISQFAKDSPNNEATFHVQEDREIFPAPSMGDVMKESNARDAAMAIADKARTLLMNTGEGGNLNDALLDWIQKDVVKPNEALAVITAMLNMSNSPAANTLTRLRGLLSIPLEDKQHIIIGPTVEKTALGETSPSGVITLNGKNLKESGSSVMETLLHEVIHAGISEHIETLNKENPEALQPIIDAANGLVKTLQKSGKNPDLLRELQRQKNDRAALADEYITWVLSQSNGGEANAFNLLFNQAFQDGAIRGITSALTQNGTKKLKLRNSQDKVNNELFEDIEARQLVSEGLQQVFDELNRYGEVEQDSEHRLHLQNLLDTFLIPGLASIDPLYAKIGIDPTGTKNVGDVELGGEQDLMRIQAAGNKLSNNAEMSLQEIFTHELTHAILGPALQTNRAFHAEARRIFEAVKDRVEWHHFMPKTVVGDLHAAQQAARERYDYIFNNFDPNDSYYLQEFISIAMTNKEFGTVLSQLDVPATNKPIFDGGILSSIVNLFERAVAWLRGRAYGTTRATDAQDAINKLAHHVMTLQLQQKQRSAMKTHDTMLRNKVDQRLVKAAEKRLDQIQEAMRLLPSEKDKKGIVLNIRRGTHGALAMRQEGHTKAMREFHRYLKLTKNNVLAEMMSEVLPYNKDDRGTAEGKPGMIDLLRKSKVMIDIARQRAIEHSRSTLLKSFDPKKRLTRKQREAITAAVLRTDLVSILQHNRGVEGDPESGMHYGHLANLLESDGLVNSEIARLERELDRTLTGQGIRSVRHMYLNQIESLASYMTRGVMTQYNGMKNAHNIVHQYNLAHRSDRIPVPDANALIPLVDQLATLRAIQMTSKEKKDSAMEVIRHEMSRNEDDGFFYLLGMHDNFKKNAQTDLFAGNPTQMQKGYIYEIADPDVNVEVITETPENVALMKQQGMVRIGAVGFDVHDTSWAHGSRYPRAMYKGVRGPSTWQKATVSLSDLHRRGVNLWELNNYDPKEARNALGDMKAKTNRDALQQFKAGNRVNPGDGSIAVPVLNPQGEIVDYTYEMSRATKEQHLQTRTNKDFFDAVMPRMYGSIVDRVETPKINREVADLLYDEWSKLKNSQEHAFVLIGKNQKGRAKEFYQILPQDMKDYLNEKFKNEFAKDTFPIRDDLVNLTLGFRKLSVLDIPAPGGKKLIRGKYTFAVKTAEKVWQEIMQLVRIKVALINPQVVVGNISSNFGILMAEGIPAEYIKNKTNEAIKGMRQYTKDVKKHDELVRKIGVYEAAGRNTQRMKNERDRLAAELANNPVSQLVKEGLFTSIVEEATQEDDTYREWILGGAADKVTGFVPRKAMDYVKEAYMIPGTNSFNMAIAATQYGDFIGRYVKFKYDTEVKKRDEREAIHEALATFIYYDMPQNRWLQAANDNGFFMFSKFFLRIQPVVARLFSQNPIKATGVMGVQYALASPFSENIGHYALFNGAPYRIQPLPYKHLEKLDPTEPSLFQWLLGPFGL